MPITDQRGLRDELTGLLDDVKAWVTPYASILDGLYECALQRLDALEKAYPKPFNTPVEKLNLIYRYRKLTKKLSKWSNRARRIEFH